MVLGVLWCLCAFAVLFSSLVVVSGLLGCGFPLLWDSCLVVGCFGCGVGWRVLRRFCVIVNA